MILNPNQPQPSPEDVSNNFVPSSSPTETLAASPSSSTNAAQPNTNPSDPSPQAKPETPSEAGSESAAAPQDEMQFRILSALTNTIHALNLPETPLLVREAVLLLDQHLDDDDAPSIEAIVKTAQDNLKEHFKVFVASLQLPELVDFLGSDTVEAIRLMEIQRLQNNVVKDAPTAPLNTQKKTIASRSKKKQSASGLYLDAFKSKFAH